MSNEQFKADFARILESVGERAVLVARKTAIQIANELIERSPVDTGRFRANWMTGYGSVNLTITTDTDKSGGATSGRIAQELAGWDGESVTISNSLPYAQRLEDGWSQQAAQGMVGLTVQRWQQYLGDALREVK